MASAIRSAREKGLKKANRRLRKTELAATMRKKQEMQSAAQVQINWVSSRRGMPLPVGLQGRMPVDRRRLVVDGGYLLPWHRPLL